MAGFKHEGGKRGFKGAPRGSFGGGFGGKKFGAGSRGGFGGPKKFGSKPFKKFDRADGPVEMHDATCDTCKKPCRVPFKPTGDKPVYCRDCFAGRAALGGERSFHKERKFPLAAGRTPQPAPKYESGEGHSLKKQVDALNIKIDRLIEMVEGLMGK